jgi:hypothetical protein
MKHLQLIALIACSTSFVSCESTETAGGRGTQESKRLAAVRHERQQQAQADEAQQNLWSSQENTLNRDGNPARRY